jgi:hypothetical protein
MEDRTEPAAAGWLATYAGVPRGRDRTHPCCAGDGAAAAGERVRMRRASLAALPAFEPRGR